MSVVRTFGATCGVNRRSIGTPYRRVTSASGPIEFQPKSGNLSTTRATGLRTKPTHPMRSLCGSVTGWCRYRSFPILRDNTPKIPPHQIWLHVEGHGRMRARITHNPLLFIGFLEKCGKLRKLPERPMVAAGVVYGIFCPVAGLVSTPNFLQQCKCLRHSRQPLRPLLVNKPG